MSGNTAETNSPGTLKPVLQIVSVIALIYYLWILFDLVTHPFSQGNNPILLPYLFRWLSAMTGTFTVVVALFIIRRVPVNINGQLLLLLGVGIAGWSLRTDFAPFLAPGFIQFFFIIYFLCIATSSLYGLLIFFPSGRAFPSSPPNWASWFLVIAVLMGLLTVSSTPSSDPAIPNPLFVPGLSPFNGAITSIMLIVLPALALISLLMRYRSGGQVERQQIRWLLWLAGIGVIVSITLSILAPTTNNNDPALSLATRGANVVGYIFWQAYPAAAIGIALLRYRLWDIDRIIRRTLLYSILTVLFGLVYYGSVVLLRQALGGLTGKSNTAIVLSTLLVAALFRPVHRRVQLMIDRRFYRQKYDAARALEDFSTVARSEVALEQLTANLTDVIQQTVQPERVSVWIRSLKSKPLE